MKKLGLILGLLIVIAIGFTGCKGEATSDSVMNEKIENLVAEANRQVGVPALTNFQEKKTLKWIYELCDQEDLICYAYLYNYTTGDIGRYLGKCIGYGVPYSTQFSNPVKYQGVTTDKVIHDGARDWTYAYELMPQAEPNGLFKPEGMSATWLIMIDPKTNEPRPMYVEPAIIVSPFKLD
jgi:hypothetical protein